MSSLCALCGLQITLDSGLCPHHSMAYGEDWAVGNRIWCNAFHGVNTDVSDFDLVWIVALLEGEGCFTAEKHSTKYPTRYPRITLAMTDRDVVKRAADLLGCKSVMGPYTHPVNRPGKPMFRCVLTGRRAEVWMRKLGPLMGIRRREKIEEILSQWGEGHPTGNNLLPRLSPSDRVEADSWWVPDAG